MAGLATTLNTANTGLQAQQAALNVTSHNVANADTVGYTRERAALQANGASAIGQDGPFGAQVGNGVTVSSIQRIRDVFLDYQVRAATSVKGTDETKDSYMTQIQSIMNEPSGTGLSSVIDTFYTNWQTLSKDPQSSNSRTLVAQQTKTLTDTLNDMYNKLQKLQTDSQTSLQNTVSDINNKLNQVDKLNQQIMDLKSAGTEPNDLMDQRDLLVDQLSENFNLKSSPGNLESITLTAGDSLTAGSTLVNPTDSSSENRLAYISGIDKQADGSYNITYYKNGATSDANSKCTINATGLSDDQVKQLQENRVLWANSDGVAVDSSNNPIGTAPNYTTGSVTYTSTSTPLQLFTPSDGVLTGTTQVQQNIDKYTDDLNKLAKSIALSVNAIEEQSSTAEAAGADTTNDFFVDKNGGNENTITAGNITINTAILNDPSKIVASATATSGTTDGTRALAVAQSQNTLLNVQDITTSTTRSDLIGTGGLVLNSTTGVSTIANSSTGTTTGNYYSTTIDVLGEDAQKASKDLTNQTTIINSLTQTRASVSSVSIDEEMTNMIQFQHAYAANAKIISTVDSLLDVVVNGLMK